MIEVFISQFRNKRLAYGAWGRFVTSEIIEKIEIDSELKENLFKIPAQLRLKKESSIWGKAERYGISDFSAAINDLVGIRFVVLLTSELVLIENAIQKSDQFEWRKVRDYGLQTEANPELFEYQSIHYLVSPKKKKECEGVIIEPEITCEVQIRTLLQHAYAELTHDNIYKPVQIVPSSARRLVARSMALMETTDELFCGTLESLKFANAPRNDLLKKLTSLYFENVTADTDSIDVRTNLMVIDTFRENIDFANAYDQVFKLLDNNRKIFELVLERRGNSFLFAQPVVLLMYSLVFSSDYFVKNKWTLLSLKEQLRMIFSDLSIAWGDEL
jgi:putative GTP pyrophosphokinase